MQEVFLRNTRCIFQISFLTLLLFAGIVINFAYPGNPFTILIVCFCVYSVLLAKIEPLSENDTGEHRGLEVLAYSLATCGLIYLLAYLYQILFAIE